MAKLAKLSMRLNRVRTQNDQGASALPRFYLLSDAIRLPDPSHLLARLPKGAAVILRHTDPRQLEILAGQIVPRAQALGLRVLIAGDIRFALAVGADGIHLSERTAQRGPSRISHRKPGFLITAAAHNEAAAMRAKKAGAQAVLLSPVFATQSHPGTRPLGILRFANLARVCPLAVIALGGLTSSNVQQLVQTQTHGFAAVGLWAKRA